MEKKQKAQKQVFWTFLSIPYNKKTSVQIKTTCQVKNTRYILCVTAKARYYEEKASG